MKKLTSDHELRGQTIRWVGYSDDGDQVLVFESGAWAVLEGDVHDDGTADVVLCWRKRAPHEVLSPGDLLDAGLCDEETMQRLIRERNEREAARLRKKMADAQRDLERLEHQLSLCQKAPEPQG